MKMADFSLSYFNDIQNALKESIATDKSGKILSLDEALEQWVDIAEDKRNKDGIFFLCGNGASATIAEHLSHDCFQNADFHTETVSEVAHITAISNDLSYEEVFAYRIRKMLKEKDMLITISSSGNSPNIIKAIETARNLGAYIVTISGKKEDNKSRKLGDLNFWVPLNTYGMVESAHSVLLHCWLDMYLEKYKGERH